MHWDTEIHEWDTDDDDSDDDDDDDDDDGIRESASESEAS